MQTKGEEGSTKTQYLFEMLYGQPQTTSVLSDCATPTSGNGVIAFFETTIEKRLKMNEHACHHFQSTYVKLQRRAPDVAMAPLSMVEIYSCELLLTIIDH